MKQMLALPVTDCPPPAKHYDYPICQVQMGRKALSTHLRKEHQADRPSNFPFWPDRDMLPGRLACNHCYNVFKMDFALQTDFRRAACPVLLCK